MSRPIRILPMLPDQRTRNRQDRVFVLAILATLIVTHIAIACVITVCRS